MEHELLILSWNLGSPRVLAGFLLFIGSITCLHIFGSCCDVSYDLHVKPCAVRVYFHLFCRGLMFYLFVFISEYWCSARFPYQMMFVISFLRNTHDGWHEWAMEVPTHHEHLSSPPCVMVFVLLNI